MSSTHHTLLDDQALAWLVRLNSGAPLPKAQEDAFLAWLQASSAHQAAYIRAEHLWQQADIVDTLTRSANANTSNPALARTNKTQKPALAWPFGNGAWPFGNMVWPFGNWSGNWAAAYCALFIIIAIGVFTLRTSPTRYHLVSAVGEQRQVTLEDGSQLLLNTNSQVDVEYTQGRRIANLIRGEVYFDVQSNPQRPFDVLTEFGMVRVVGTHFSVRQQQSDATVTVLEGRVALGKKPTSKQEFSALVELNNNQQLSLQQAHNGDNPKPLNAKTALAWRDKQLVYQKQKLALVVSELNRYFAVKISLSDAAMGDKDITAVIQLGDLKTTLAALCQPLNLHAQYAANNREVILIPASNKAKLNP
ncbi:MAG: hypothetical protein RL497_2498 [Pseudomonadota bacterium]|jgi:transmembrane sensor